VRRQKIIMTVGGDTVKAHIWPRSDVKWEINNIDCPLCGQTVKSRPVFDIIQYGLIDHDIVVTIFRCPLCDKSFGVKYVLPKVDNEENEVSEV